MNGLHFFDPKQDFTVAWRRLPHWSQAGTVCFMTWRTADSLPWSALERLAAERGETLRRFGIEAPDAKFRRNVTTCRHVSPKLDEQIAKLSPLDKAKLRWQLFRAWDSQLDMGAGQCVLARPELSAIVERSLRHFDGERYVLIDSVVMPNHVHVLAAFADEDQLLAQTASWKRFTSGHINAVLRRQGIFWQVEQFDHLVRSLEQFEYLRRYLAENPDKAGLAAGSYRRYSKRL